MHILPDYSDLCTCDQGYGRYFFHFTEKRRQVGWYIRRDRAEITYRIHTDAVRENLFPPELPKPWINAISPRFVRSGWLNDNWERGAGIRLPGLPKGYVRNHKTRGDMHVTLQSGAGLR